MLLSQNQYLPLSGLNPLAKGLRNTLSVRDDISVTLSHLGVVPLALVGQTAVGEVACVKQDQAGQYREEDNLPHFSCYFSILQRQGSPWLMLPESLASCLL